MPNDDRYRPSNAVDSRDPRGLRTLEAMYRDGPLPRYPGEHPRAYASRVRSLARELEFDHETEAEHAVARIRRAPR